MIVKYGAFRLDDTTIDKLMLAQRLAGFKLGLVQGSYTSSVAASAGTHSGGGAVDLHCSGETTAYKTVVVWSMRCAGFASWHRPPNWDGAGGTEHVHSIEIGSSTLSPEARSQIDQWNAGTNGLANHAKDSDNIDLAAGRPAITRIEEPSVTTVLDIAWDQPTVAQIKGTGAVGVMRYFSTDTSKNLTAAHVQIYTAAGLAVGAVWETTALRALAGFAAGQTDAKAAEAQRKACGLPDDQVIYFAVDTDANWADVVAYCDGFVSQLGIARVGVYGSFKIVEAAYAYGIRFLWQTLAWSSGQHSAHACLYQNGTTVLSGGADVNNVLAANWGQYPHPQEVDMPLTQADADLVVKTLLAPGNRDSLVGFVSMYWLDKAMDPATSLDATTNVGAQVAAVRAQFAKRDAAIATLADALKVVVAQSQSNGSGLTALQQAVDRLSAAVAAIQPGAVTVNVDPQVVHDAVKAELNATKLVDP